MQVWNENNTMLYEENIATRESIKKEILNLIRNEKNKNLFIAEFVLDRHLKYCQHLNKTWEELYYLSIYSNIINNFKKRYKNTINKSNNIIKKLIVKKKLREYILERLYRYPDGLRLNSLKLHFNELSNN